MSFFLKKSPLSDEQLLGEIEDIIRTSPPFGVMGDDSLEQHAWFGRALSILVMWDSSKQIMLEMAARQAFEANVARSREGRGRSSWRCNKRAMIYEFAPSDRSR